MALEQSLVMGVALAYLFFRMLAESEAEDQRAERYEAPALTGRLALAPASRRLRAARSAEPAEHQRPPRRGRSRRGRVMPSPARCRSSPTPSASSVLTAIRPSRASVGPRRP